MKLLLAIAAALALTALWLDSRAAVPCDAQAGQMQAPKLTLEQRVERLEKRVQEMEDFTDDLRDRMIYPEDISHALDADLFGISEEAIRKQQAEDAANAEANE